MVTLGPKKDGSPNAEFFQSSETLQEFESVRQWLQKHHKKYVQSDPPTKETLAQLIIQLVQYQDSKLGKNNSDPAITRFPMRCFMDFKPGGALCTIFSTMYKFKHDQRWKKFDFTIHKNNNKKDPIIQMMLEIESALIETECMRMPVLFIRSEVDKALCSKLKEILNSRKGVVITEDEDEASHIVYPVVDPLPEEYARPGFKRERHVMIHWYYFPDSYDSWVPHNMLDLPDNIPESPPSPNELWRVSASWVLDLKQYNEWMSEEDYEVDEQGKKKVHQLRLSVDDLMPSGNEDKTKKANQCQNET